MPVYETLDAVADSGGTQAVEPKVNRLTFRDQYDQVSSNGRNHFGRTMNLTFTCDNDEADVLMDFFIRHRGTKPFWFSFNKVEPLRLMVTEGAFNKNHIGGLKYTVTAVFKNFGGLHDAQ